MSEQHFQVLAISSTPDVRWIIDYIAKERCDGNRSAAIRHLVRVAAKTLGIEYPPYTLEQALAEAQEPQKGE